MLFDHERNEVLIHATAWINFKNTVLSERSQAQKITYHMIPFIRNIQNRKVLIYSDRNSISDQLGGGEMEGLVGDS